MDTRAKWIVPGYHVDVVLGADVSTDDILTVLASVDSESDAPMPVDVAVRRAWAIRRSCGL